MKGRERLKPNSKLGCKLTVTVSSEELSVIERRMQELGCKSLADFQRKAMEEEAGWDFMMKEVFPKVMQEAREHSRTPHLDCAFIEGVMSGLNARRALNAVGQKP